MSLPTKQYQDLSAPFGEKTHAKLIGWLFKQRHSQQTAATLAAALLGLAEFPGQVGDLFVLVQSTPGAGESMTVDVLKNGVSMLSGVLTLNATSDVTTQISLMGLLTAAGKDLAVGDVITVSRVYTAGGTPAPLGATTVVLEPTVSPYNY